MTRLILALPAYNEARGIGPLLIEADRVFNEMAEVDAEILLVDDGSTDNTVQAAESVTLSTPLTVARHPENRGLGQAFMTCLREGLARAASDDDWIVTMDSDNTHPPAAIPRMLEKANEGYDLIIASRYRPGSRQLGVPWNRRLMSFGARWLFWWKLRLPGVRDYTCGFRAYKAWVVRKGLETYGDQLITRAGFACTDELLVKLSHFKPRIAEAPFVLRYDRKQGRSKIELWKTIRETLKMLWKEKE